MKVETEPKVERPREPETSRDPVADFVARHQVPVWRFLRLLGADPATAEELTQDVLVRALRDGPGLVDRNPAAAHTVAGWLRTTARNRWIDERRGRRRARERTGLDELDAAAVDRAWDRLVEGDAAAVRQAALRHCLDALPERSRRALELRYGGEAVSRERMAEVLGIGAAGVKQLLRRLRTGLRECIERRLG